MSFHTDCTNIRSSYCSTYRWILLQIVRPTLLKTGEAYWVPRKYVRRLEAFRNILPVKIITKRQLIDLLEMWHSSDIWQRE
jgi:hypothetical protein